MAAVVARSSVRSLISDGPENPYCSRNVFATRRTSFTHPLRLLRGSGYRLRPTRNARFLTLPPSRRRPLFERRQRLLRLVGARELRVQRQGARELGARLLRPPLPGQHHPVMVADGGVLLEAPRSLRDQRVG